MPAKCVVCEAVLSRLGSVIYEEKYSARLDGADSETTLIADAFTIESSAICARCGAEIVFDRIDLSSGGLADGSPRG